jgi:hypothetical protein
VIPRARLPGVDLASKLQLKTGQSIECVAVPDPVAAVMDPLSDRGDGMEPAALFFVVDRAALERSQDRIVEAASTDRLTWVAYPKSGQLGTDLNRDSLAALLTGLGVQPVRQIAIDEVWSALRFRPGSGGP